MHILSEDYFKETKTVLWCVYFNAVKASAFDLGYSSGFYKLLQILLVSIIIIKIIVDR